MNFRRLASACALSVFASAVVLSPANADPVVGPDMSCVAPAGDPAPNTPEWIQRDTLNQYCAGLRNRDQLLNPAFGNSNLTEGARLYAEQTIDQIGDPTHPRGGTTTLIPGS